jgi:hypothetical protein
MRNIICSAPLGRLLAPFNHKFICFFFFIKLQNNHIKVVAPGTSYLVGSRMRAAYLNKYLIPSHAIYIYDKKGSIA